MARKKSDTPLEKQRRQIEILVRIKENPSKLSVADLCVEFKRETATLHRDLSALRGLGIDIHSQKKRLVVRNPIDESLTQRLIQDLLAAAGRSVGYPKSVALTTKMLKDRSLSVFTSLVKAIEKRRQLKLQYEKVTTGEIVERIVEPYALIPTARDWRLIARSDDYYKQFILGHIQSILTTGKSFTRLPDFSLEEMFRNSFNSWTGGNPIHAKIRFDRSVARNVRTDIWSEDQIITTKPDGTLVVDLIATDMDQLANWLMGWEGSATVLEPPELKQLVTRKAAAVLKANE